MNWLSCWYRGWHEPLRIIYGGWRCKDCGYAMAEYSEDAEVPVLRRVFNRDAMTYTRTSNWDAR